MQFALTKMTKKQFDKSPYAKYDIDQISKRLEGEDFISIAKSVYLFRNIKPSFFNIDQLTNKKYCSIAFDSSSDEPVNRNTVKTTLNYYVKKIISLVHFVDYNFDTNTSDGISKEDALQLMKLSGIQESPSVISSTYSLENEISLGSRGARTINYYYSINNDHTLQVSIKIVSFKKEKLYSYLAYRAFGIWDSIKSQCDKNQRDGTLDVLKNISDFAKNHF